MQYDIKQVLISIEGLEVTNDKIRGKGTWEKAIDSLTYLCNLNKNKNKQTLLGIAIVINKLNSREIIELIKLTQNFNINYQITSLSIIGNAVYNKDMLEISTKELIKTYEDIAEFHAKNPEVKLNILADYPLVYDYLNRKHGTNYNIFHNVCSALTQSIYLNPYGELFPCASYEKIKINVNRNTDWKSDFSVFRPFLEILHKENKNTICNECKYKDICIPCPFKQKDMPKICIEIMKKIREIKVPLCSEFKLNKPYCIVKSEGKYEVFYPNLELKTEYSIEGVEILESIEEFKRLVDISSEVQISPEIVYEFLLQEKSSLKVIERRMEEGLKL